MKEIKSIKEIQNISLNILKFVDEVCKENNIPYSLAGGTAIGAVRHGGFIPWDDDIDIIMHRKDYDRFISIMKKSNQTRFKCITFPEHFYFFTKIVDTNTRLIETNLLDHPDMGVYIDIFPIDNINEKTYKKDVKKFHRYQILAGFAASQKPTKSKHGPLVAMIKFFCYLYAKIFGWKYWTKKAIKLSTKYNNQETSLTGIYTQYKEKDIYKKGIFDNFQSIKFEGCEFQITTKYDEYLSRLYGDYMKLPPKEKQVSHHSFKAYYKEEQD